MKEIEKITSRDNRRLVHARKVRDGKIADLIFIEGRRLVEEALRSDVIIDECFVSDNFVDGELLNAMSERGLTIAEIPNRIYDSIADTKRPQGIILIARRPKKSLATIETAMKRSTLPIVIFLKEVNNPSNLGAILRTAEAAGVPGIIVSSGSADAYSPKALRAAMGSAFRIPICEGSDFESAIYWAKKQNLRSTAAFAAADKNYTDIDWKMPTLLILGSEAHGLSDLEMKQVDEAIGIPMDDRVESLNLAVSCGVILFEARRQTANG